MTLKNINKEPFGGSIIVLDEFLYLSMKLLNILELLFKVYVNILYSFPC